MRDGSDDVTVDDVPLDLIQAAAEEMGEPLSTNDFDEWAVGVPNAAIAISKAVGWAAACQAAGVRPAEHSKQQWDEAEIQESIRECARDVGEPISQREYSNWRAPGEAPSIYLVQSEFGGWVDACRIAGVEPAGKRKANSWTRREIVNAIESADKKVENGITRKKYSELSIGNPEIPSTGSINREFGGWTDALEEIGIERYTECQDCKREFKQIEKHWERSSECSRPGAPETDGFKQKQKCQDCGSEYARLAQHWAMSSECSAPPISTDQRAMLTGLGIGGAATYDGPGSDNPKFRAVTTEPERADWWDDRLGWLSAGVRDYDPDSVDASRQVRYQMTTIAHYGLSRYEWTTGDSLPPTDADLSPLAIRAWLSHAGGISFDPGARISFGSRSSADRRRRIDRLLRSLPLDLDPTVTNRVVVLSTTDTERLQEYAAPPAPGTEHKWTSWRVDR